MTNRSIWVRWFPSDFLNGIVGLEAYEIAVYTVILNLIYDNNGPIRDDTRKIARRVGLRWDHCERIVVALVQEGKIERRDGVISNPRADKELTERTSKVAKLVSRFGLEKPLAGKKDRKINGADHPIGDKSGPDQGDRSTIEAQAESDKKKVPKKNAAKPRPAGALPQSRRIDPGLKPSNANIVFAKSRGLTHKETNFEWEKFVRYYRGLSGKNSTSPDWDAVWESWVLRAADRLGRDSFVGEATSNGHHSLEDFTREDWTQIVSVWRLTNNWSPNHGPAPGRPGCKVPSDLVTTN